MRIIITGGAGYLGMELCKLYSGESRFKKITVIDNKFHSERVRQLRAWGIEFVQASILDEEVMKKYLADADIIYHLAGITDVAYTKMQENEERDREIIEVGITGTRIVIENSGKKSKIIFPSTHVVYEGVTQTERNITEELSTCPVLTYAKGKDISEEDLWASDRNYVILRLGSVYGYSGDNTRIGIMPNLFSKIASQNGTIKLFSGGVQLKSLVPLKDVVRCLKFMGENNISRKTFHCAWENMTVREVAHLCQSFNPMLTLINTDDEIPNLGYTISNQKLLDTGFKFLYNLNDCVREMIENWSEQAKADGLEYLQKGQKEFIDARGKISNYELTEPINLIGYIESKAGTVRANHYHPIQEQKCLLVRGRYISVIQDLGVPGAPIETKMVNAGDLSVIQPNVAHAMVFTQDSVFLNLVNGEREHANYGITHTIPYELVNETMRKNLLESFVSECRCCGNKNLKRVLSLGNSPLANNLLDSPQDVCEQYPLEMEYCPDCHNCQLSVAVPSGKMFDHYLYTSSTSASFRKHFEDAAEKYIKEFNLTGNSMVVDIGSNDGIGLRPFKEKGIPVLGVEPAANIAKTANDNGIDTVHSYFNSESVKDIIQRRGKADIVTASNVFAHGHNLQEIAEQAFHLLKPDGVFIVEVQYLRDTLKDLTFDNIYHEHVNYWSVISLNSFFYNLGFHLFKAERIDTHGGSVRVYVEREGVRHLMPEDNTVSKFLSWEEDFGLTDFKTYQDFACKVKEARENVRENFRKLKEKYKTIAGFGAPAKATTALNYFGIPRQQMDYIVEDNPLKHGKYVPGANIPIVSREFMEKNIPDAVVINAWNFSEEIKKSNRHLIEKGVRFISIKELQYKDFNV